MQFIEVSYAKQLRERWWAAICRLFERNGQNIHHYQSYPLGIGSDIWGSKALICCNACNASPYLYRQCLEWIAAKKEQPREFTRPFVVMKWRGLGLYVWLSESEWKLKQDLDSQRWAAMHNNN